MYNPYGVSGTFYNDNQRIEVINGNSQMRLQRILEIVKCELLFLQNLNKFCNQIILLIVWTRCISFWLVPFVRTLDMFLFESSSECSFYRKVTQNLQKNLILVQKEFSRNGHCWQLNWISCKLLIGTKQVQNFRF